MKSTWRKACSIGLVWVIVATMLMSVPMIGAKKPGPPPPPADPAIAFARTERVSGNTIDKIMVMNADGSNQAVISQEENFRIFGTPSWSPDGNSIAWCGYTFTDVPGQNFGVWRIDVEIVEGVPQGSNLQQLVTESEEGTFYNVAWSPLGDEIAFLVHVYDQPVYKVDAVPAEGGATYNIYTAPEGYGLGNGPTWSSDGSQLAVGGGEVAAGNEGRSIFIIDRETGTVAKSLLIGEYFAGLDWARQGSNTLAFHMGDMIYTIDIDTETSVQITEGCCASWSPDNSKIVYKRPTSKPNRVNLCTYEFSSGEIEELAKGERPDWRQV